MTYVGRAIGFGIIGVGLFTAMPPATTVNPLVLLLLGSFAFAMCMFEVYRAVERFDDARRVRRWDRACTAPWPERIERDDR